jgi:hypothetical protein
MPFFYKRLHYLIIVSDTYNPVAEKYQQKMQVNALSLSVSSSSSQWTSAVGLF